MRVGSPGSDVIILRGGPAVGKSTVGRALAESHLRSALIEQDVLRYMVVGGLVGVRGGTHPKLAPFEYQRQCRIGDKNALLLASNFANAGFLPIVAGFDGGESSGSFIPPGRRWTSTQPYPSPTLLRALLPNKRVWTILLDARPAILAKRLRLRGLGEEAISFVLNQRREFLTRRRTQEFALVIDTSKVSASRAASRIRSLLKGGDRGS